MNAIWYVVVALIWFGLACVFAAAWARFKDRSR